MAQLEHQRKIIRDAIIEALKADAALLTLLDTMNGNVVPAVERVHSTRLIEWQERHMPAISVYCGTDTADAAATKNSTERRIYRAMPVTIEVAVLGGFDADSMPNPEDRLDAFCLCIERVMNKDPLFGELVADSVYNQTEFEFTAEGGRYIGVAFVQYTVEYQTGAPYAEDADLVPYLRSTIDYQPNGVGEDDQATDQITLPGASV